VKINSESDRTLDEGFKILAYITTRVQVWARVRVKLERTSDDDGSREADVRRCIARSANFLRPRFSSRARERRRYRASFECPAKWCRGLNREVKNFAQICDPSFSGDLDGTVSDLRDATLLPPLCHGAHACVCVWNFFFFFCRCSSFSLGCTPLRRHFPTGKVIF